MTKTKAIQTETSDETLIDGCFRVNAQPWGTYISVNAEGDKLVTSMSEEGCIAATRCYLQWKQEGFTKGETTYDGSVGGKL